MTGERKNAFALLVFGDSFRLPDAPRRFPHRPGAKNSGTSLFFVSVPFTNSSKRVIILRDGCRAGGFMPARPGKEYNIMATCKKCGADMDENAKQCPVCGAPVEQDQGNSNSKQNC